MRIVAEVWVGVDGKRMVCRHGGFNFFKLIVRVVKSEWLIKVLIGADPWQHLVGLDADGLQVAPSLPFTHWVLSFDALRTPRRSASFIYLQRVLEILLRVELEVVY